MLRQFRSEESKAQKIVNMGTRQRAVPYKEDQCCLSIRTEFSIGTGASEEQRRELNTILLPYARHSNDPIEFIRAVVEQESE